MDDDDDDVAVASLLCPASQSSPKECGETEVLMMIIWACLGRALGQQEEKALTLRDKYNSHYSHSYDVFTIGK